jgi:release factor glutamine methyltransferase
MRKTVGMWMNEAAKALGNVIESRQLAAFGLKKPESWLIAHDDTTLTKPRLATLERLLKRRLKQEPMPYILGSAVFFGREFLVDKRVLIPRPETEDLVEEALKIPATHYADIGTGSGAIAVTLAAESPRSHVIAGDSSSSAMAIAKKNARRLAPRRVQFFQGSLLSPLLVRAITKSSKASKSYLCIVANLPYLPPKDKRIMPKSVVNFEPSKALFTDDDGMKLNKRLLVQISRLPPPDSHLSVLLEFDPPQSKKLSAFAKSLFPDADVSIICDRCGRERILRILIKNVR